jgi:hypothetical protein
VRTRIKRLLDLDRSMGRKLRSKNAEEANFGFFSEEAPGTGADILFSEYDAFALLNGLRIMKHRWPQGFAVSIIRRVRLDLEREHARILRQDPSKLFDWQAIRARARPGDIAVHNTDPVFLRESRVAENGRCRIQISDNGGAGLRPRGRARLRSRFQADWVGTKAMAKKRTKRNDFLLPNGIAALFGYAPTLKTENNEIYWNCMERFVKCVAPQDIIEWLWVKDVVDLSWEILRLRRLKIDLVEIDREDENATIEWKREHADEPDFDFISGKRTPRDPADIEARKNKPLLDTETDSAELLFKHIEQYEHIEKLLTSAEFRRDRILREIELRRDHMGRRLRAASNEILDSQVKVPRIAAE